MSRIANEVGNTADSATYRAMANALQAAMNTNLINASGVYVDGLEPNGTQSTHASQHANAFPLSLNIVPAAQQASVTAQVGSLRHERERAGHHPARARARRGQPGAGVAESLHQRTQYGWAQILSLGGTATWESWTANTDGNSESHGWGAVGLDGYVRYILGVKPLTAQFEQVQIKPLDFGNSLASASGTVPTDRGAISRRVGSQRRAVSSRRHHPGQRTATVYVPQAGVTNTTVKVDGVNVTGTVTNGYLAVSGIGSGAHIIERVLDPLFAKTQWLQANFTPAELADPAISGDNADPDHDGIVNELEYAFGLDPNNPLARPAATAALRRPHAVPPSFPAQRSELRLRRADQHGSAKLDHGRACLGNQQRHPMARQPHSMCSPTSATSSAVSVAPAP